MHPIIAQRLSSLSPAIQTTYQQLRELLLALPAVEETVWAKLPTYQNSIGFVRLIPFNTHINIEISHPDYFLDRSDSLTNYTFTPKGMMQLHAEQPIPHAVLTSIFAQELNATAADTTN